MYLKNIAIKNIGPINELNIKMPFDKNGNPKPVIFVGENGTGKTILLSQIMDSFYEIGSTLFGDVGRQSGLNRSYYKLSGSINLQSGKDKGFSLLKFVDKENNPLEYFDKIGDVTQQDFTHYISDFSLTPNNNHKEITTIDDTKKEKLQNEWHQDAYFYQPAYRYEEPFWKNEPFLDKKIKFEDQKKFSGKLGKPLEIVSSTKQNKSFLLDLALDFTTFSSSQNAKIISRIKKRIKEREEITLQDLSKNEISYDELVWEKVNEILRRVKKRFDIRFGVGLRNSGTRISIVEQNEDGSAKNEILPSIDNLSLGESILLNLFINIVRYSGNIKNLWQEIRGVVLIDEIDTHLHTNLQYSVLPKLIKDFPKIQFIITSHSPVFLLGMEEEFNQDGFEIREMPTGKQITAERFREFGKAFETYKNTKKFEDIVKDEVQKTNKPILYVEDEYYQIYQIAYLKLKNIPCDESNFIEKFDSNSPFVIKTGKSAGGVSGLLRVKDSSVFEDKKIIGLFDFDREGRENFHNLSNDSYWKNGTEGGDLKNGFYKKRKDHNCMHAYLLPIPDRLKHLASLDWENFISYVEIENLLPESFLQNNGFIDEKTAPGGIAYYKCKKDVKNKLWKKLFNLDVEAFQDFKPLFNTLNKIVNSSDPHPSPN